MLCKFLILVFSIYSRHVVRAGPITEMFEDVRETIQFGSDISRISGGEDAIQIILKEDNMRDVVNELAASVENIANDLRSIETRLSNDIQQSTRTIIERLRLTNKYDEQLNELAGLMHEIDNKYNDFRMYWTHEQLNDQVFVTTTIKEFIDSVVSVSNSGGLVKTLKLLHDLIIPGFTKRYKESLLTLMLKDSDQTKNERCGKEFSPQQEIYKLYEEIKLLEIKAFAMMKFAYVQLSLQNRKSYLRASKVVDLRFDERNINYYEAFTEAMSKAPLDIRPCDAEEPKRNVTYIEMERLYELAIIEETFRRRYHRNEYGEWKYEIYGVRSDNCIGFVPNNSSTDDFLAEHAKYGGREPKQCHGFLYDCQVLANEMEICHSSEYNKRYQYFKANGVTYGDASRDCSGQLQTLSTTRHVFSVHVNDVCVCKCYNHNLETPGLVNLANLDAQKSDIKNNKIITGIKFERDGHTLFLKIKQAKLGPSGATSDESEYIGRHKPAQRRTMSSWMIIGRQNNRFLQMKDHFAPADHVITGVRFISLMDSKFGIQIQCTPVDFVTGELQEGSFWLDPDPAEGTTRTWDEPDDPNKFSMMSAVDSNDDEYIEFSLTSMAADASSSIVPFLDAQPVEATPGFPLGGIGIIHKGVTGSGGYFAFRIHTFDFTDFVPMPHNSTTVAKDVLRRG